VNQRRRCVFVARTGSVKIPAARAYQAAVMGMATSGDYCCRLGGITEYTQSESPLSLGPLSGLASCEVDRASSVFPSDDSIASQPADGQLHTDFPSASAIMVISINLDRELAVHGLSQSGFQGTCTK
jgi:hypothetical protein